MNRPLKAKNILQVETSTDKLVQKNTYLELIYSITALDMVHTALIVVRNLCYPENRIKLLPQLAGSDVKSLKSVIELIKPQYNSIRICGHVLL